MLQIKYYQTKVKSNCKQFFPSLIIAMLIFGCASILYQGKYNTIESYEEYLKEHPAFSDSSESLVNIEKLYYEKAKELQSIGAYQYYLKIYPNGIYAHQAKENIEKLSFRYATSEGSMDDLDQFVATYPKSKWTADKLEKLYYERAKRDNSIQSFSTYFREFPQGIYQKNAFQSTIDAVQHSFFENRDSTFTLDKIKSYSKSILKISELLGTSKEEYSLRAFLFESLALHYIRLGMYHEARLAISFAMDNYNRIGSYITIEGDQIRYFFEDSTIKSDFNSGFFDLYSAEKKEVVQLFKRMLASYYDDLKYFNKIENNVSIVKLFNILSKASSSDDESITYRKEDVIKESDHKFCQYVMDYFTSGKGNSFISNYLYRFDADSTCYSKIKVMMEEDPIDYSAIDALQGVGDCIRDSLVNIIISGESSNSRVHAVLGLAWMKKDSTILELLSKQLNKEQDKKVLLSLHFTIEKLKGSDDIEPVLQMLNSKESDLRKMALSLLRYTRNTVPGERYVNILERGNEKEQYFGCQIVKRSPYSEEVIKALVPLLGSNDEDVCAEAKETLEHFLPECMSNLIQTLNDKNPDIREKCISLLSEGSDTTGYQAVINYYKNEHRGFSTNDFEFYKNEVEKEYADEFRRAELRAIRIGGYVSQSAKQQFIEDVSRKKADQFLGNVYLAFGRMKYKQGVTEIIEHLNDDVIYRYAALALVLYSDMGLVNQIKNRFNASEYISNEKIASAFILAGYGYTDGKDYLLQRLQGKDFDSIINLISMIQPIEAIPILERLICSREGQLIKGKKVDYNKESLREICSLLAKLYIKQNI